MRTESMGISQKIIEIGFVVIGAILPLVLVFISLIQENFQPYYTWSELWFMFPVSVSAAVFLISLNRLKFKESLVGALMANTLFLVFVSYILKVIKTYKKYLTYPQLYAPLEIILPITAVLAILCIEYFKKSGNRKNIILTYLVFTFIGISLFPSYGAKFGGPIGWVIVISLHSIFASLYYGGLYLIRQKVFVKD